MFILMSTTPILSVFRFDFQIFFSSRENATCKHKKAERLVLDTALYLSQSQGCSILNRKTRFHLDKWVFVTFCAAPTRLNVFFPMWSKQSIIGPVVTGPTLYINYTSHALNSVKSYFITFMKVLCFLARTKRYILRLFCQGETLRAEGASSFSC